jgi:photosystem II stability/assembly factor-like uncharacterized protein
LAIDPSRPRPGFPLRRPALAAAALLLSLTAGSAPLPSPPREILVHGQRLLGPGLPPTLGGEDEEGGSEREHLIRWIESRHRTAPGVDWRAIEARNFQASLASAAALEKRGGARPVWHERGPVNQTGATAFTAVAPDGKTLLVATSQGGIFSGTPGAKSWKRLTDSLGGYIRGFTVSPRPEVWAAAVSSGLTGGQVYASRNRGATWSASRGLPSLYTVFEMIQDGGHPQTVYLLAASYLNGGRAVPILARSRDGGLTFSLVYAGSDYERPGIWTSRTSSGPLYLMSHGQLLVSADQGSSFSPLGQAASEATNFAVLRGSEAGAPTFYAALGTKSAADTLYASEDGGGTWQSRFQLTGTSYYAFDALYSGGLAASQRDPNLVLFGNANAFRSTDGGRSFQAINNWSDYYDDPGGRLHADINGIHFLTYRGQEALFLSTDGGTFLSTDGGSSVRNITQFGLPSAQLYSTWSSGSNPNLFLAGTQDQGFQLSIPSSGSSSTALGNTQLLSGDYSGLTAASHDLTSVFALYPTSSAAKGFLLLFTLEGGGQLFSAPLPAMSRSGFFATSLADPDDPATVYVAGDHIWKMTHRGNGDFSQSQLSQNFSTDQQDYVAALAIAPSDHDVWYASTFEGRLWYSHDHGSTWTESDTTRGQSPYGSGSTLAVAPGDPFTAYAGGSGYGSPPVQVTHDGGVTWSDLSNGLPATFAWALAFDGSAAQTLYAATETGPYVFDSRARTWKSLLGGGAPPGEYFSVEGLPGLHLVRFGTYSRGVWDYVPSTR